MDQNLIVIMSDEHQSKALSGLGHFVKTPNLDQLMTAGTTFTNAYTPSPICVPARASFATGHYAHQLRLWDNAMPYAGQFSSWGHSLQRAGITVESIGKLHYRDPEDDNGFDKHHLPMMVIDGVGMVWGSIRDEDRRISPPSRMLGDTIGAGSSKYIEYDQAVTEATLRWLKDRDRKTPFCLYIGLVAPHFPLVAPPAFFDRYNEMDLPEPKLSSDPTFHNHPWIELLDAQMPTEDHFASPEERHAAIVAYYALVSWLDHNVGQILSTLDATGLAENTTVIYASDHGDNVGARKLWGKSNFYEESAAVPLIARGAGFAAGQTVATPVSLIDLSVTIPAHFGLSLTDKALGPAPGQDLRALAQQPFDANRVVFSEYHAVGAVSGGFMVRKGDWKYIHYLGFEPEMFDLANDPEETINLAGQPQVAKKQAELHAELLEICDPEATNAQAFADQRALIARYGGLEAALKLGAPGATPPPRV